MTRATTNTFTLPSSAPQAGWCSPCAAHLQPTIRRKTTEVNARLPVSSSLDTLSKELPTRSAEERQHLLEQVLCRHALRVGLSVFQQIFEVLVVDCFLKLLEGSAAAPHSCVREAEEQAHVLREAVVVVGHEVAVLQRGQSLALAQPAAEENGPERAIQRGQNQAASIAKYLRQSASML